MEKHYGEALVRCESYPRRKGRIVTKYTSVLVRWVDSRTPTCSWQHWDEVEIPVVCECESVGFLIGRDEKQITLASHLNDVTCGVQVMGVMSIPSCAALEVKRLR